MKDGIDIPRQFLLLGIYLLDALLKLRIERRGEGGRGYRRDRTGEQGGCMVEGRGRMMVR